jgi:hypothetical protein
MRKSIVKKGKVKSTFIYLCMLFKEFHVRFGTESNNSIKAQKIIFATEPKNPT